MSEGSLPAPEPIVRWGRKLPRNELGTLKSTMEHAFKSTELAPSERAAVERLLGRPLENDETVAVITRKERTSVDEHKPEERPIWEIILDNMKDVPREEFAKLPNDGASEHDHYLYGHPKRGE